MTWNEKRHRDHSSKNDTHFSPSSHRQLFFSPDDDHQLLSLFSHQFLATHLFCSAEAVQFVRHLQKGKMGRGPKRSRGRNLIDHSQGRVSIAVTSHTSTLLGYLQGENEGNEIFHRAAYHFNQIDVGNTPTTDKIVLLWSLLGEELRSMLFILFFIIISSLRIPLRLSLM